MQALFVPLAFLSPSTLLFTSWNHWMRWLTINIMTPICAFAICFPPIRFSLLHPLLGDGDAPNVFFSFEGATIFLKSCFTSGITRLAQRWRSASEFAPGNCQGLRYYSGYVWGMSLKGRNSEGEASSTRCGRETLHIPLFPSPAFSLFLFSVHHEFFLSQVPPLKLLPLVSLSGI